MFKQKFVLEWVAQADYDFETSRSLFKTGRYIYCVFMCHLALEKLLKGLYHQHIQKFPPKTHNLLYLLKAQQQIVLTKLQLDFLSRLDEASIPTRYPEDLSKAIKSYPKSKAQSILRNTQELMICLKKNYLK